jgi:hypothetical protein
MQVHPFFLLFQSSGGFPGNPKKPFDLFFESQVSTFPLYPLSRNTKIYFLNIVECTHYKV